MDNYIYLVPLLSINLVFFVEKTDLKRKDVSLRGAGALTAVEIKMSESVLWDIYE